MRSADCQVDHIHPVQAPGSRATPARTLSFEPRQAGSPVSELHRLAGACPLAAAPAGGRQRLPWVWRATASKLLSDGVLMQATACVRTKPASAPGTGPSCRHGCSLRAVLYRVALWGSLTGSSSRAPVWRPGRWQQLSWRLHLGGACQRQPWACSRPAGSGAEAWSCERHGGYLRPGLPPDKAAHAGPCRCRRRVSCLFCCCLMSSSSSRHDMWQEAGLHFVQIAQSGPCRC